METKITRENISQHLMEYQLELAGASVMDVIDKLDTWRFDITLTREKQEEFKKYSIKLIQKIFKINKTKAEETFNFFWEKFGVRIKG